MEKDWLMKGFAENLSRPCFVLLNLRLICPLSHCCIIVISLGAGLTILLFHSFCFSLRSEYGDDDTRYKETTVIHHNSFKLHDTRRQDTKRATFRVGDHTTLTIRVHECLRRRLPHYQHHHSHNGYAVCITATTQPLDPLSWCALRVCFALRCVTYFPHTAFLLRSI